MPRKLPPVPPERPDDVVLDELRERRTVAGRAWETPRKEAQKDVQCVAGEVWEALAPDGKRLRDASMRPTVACDEIGQYLNQVGNDVRQNKRAIKATPKGLGATKKTAEFRSNLIREIEYESNAQRDVYSPMLEDALQRGYAFGRINSRYVSPLSKHQELYIEVFPNPDVVLPDPDGAMLSPDCAKIEYAFVLDAAWTTKRFKREFGDSARVVDFTEEHAKIAPDWIRGDRLTLAEYWTIERMQRRVVFLKADPNEGVFADEFDVVPPDNAIDDERMEDFPTVCQYFTNGIELLAKKGEKKRTIWRGKSIPIFSCFGKVLYVQTGVGTERRLMSMVRLMRPAVMGFAYADTCKLEILGSVPRATWVGYEGQFRGHEDEWAKANHEPVPYLVAKPFTEATSSTLLPLPQRQSWDPPLQNVEMAAESFRRRIQAAAGTSPLPTEAQRQNQKSGKALDRIESSGQKGSFHFVDHLDGTITRVGVLLDENIGWCYDAMREVTIRNDQDQPDKVTINDPNDEQSIDATLGHHDITISVGPAYTDEREASSEFADSIVGNAPLMQTIGPQKGSKLIADAIRLKAVGPIGDRMANTIDPPPPEPGEPPTPEQLQAQQGELDALRQANAQLQQQIALDEAKQRATIEAKRLEIESRERIELARLQAQREDKESDREVKLAVAELGAKVERMSLFLEERARLGTQDHETVQAAQDRAHDVGMAHLEHQHGLEASEQAAELAPEPAAGV